MTPDRFFALLLALQSREVLTAGELADQAGVSVRTVLRDLQWLQEAGFPLVVQRGRRGGVRLLPGGSLDTSRLTPIDRDHLSLNGLDDEQRFELGAASDARRAREKIAARRNSATPLPISDVVTTDNRPWFGPERRGTEPSALIGDVRRGVRLRVRYRRSEAAVPVWQLVDPYGLLAKAGRWYLVADRSGVARLYSLERLVDWRATRVPRRLRSGRTLEGVARELTARWEELDSFQIHAVLDAYQLDRAHRILGSRLTVRDSGRGDRVAIAVACRELEDVRQLLPFAGNLAVTDPPEVRDRIRELAAELLGRYSQP